MAIYGALLLTGLLGSLGHCLGMCGPLVTMAGLQFGVTGLPSLPRYLLYHGARAAVYGVLGAIVGEVGSLLGLGPRLGTAASVLSLVLGLGIALLGFEYLGWLSILRVVGAGGWWKRATTALLDRARYAWGIASLGALNGLLPCGLVYSALLVTASAGGPLPGAAGMLIFGASTAPALLIIGVGAGALSARVRRKLARASGFVIVAIGLQLVLRGTAALGLVPHLRLGGVMLW
jgi:sulfite exporter TauE/SafE